MFDDLYIVSRLSSDLAAMRNILRTSLPSNLSTIRNIFGTSRQSDQPPTGNTAKTLRRLYSLRTSSLDFIHTLHSLIQFDEEEEYLTSLKKPELKRLLDFLDKVRTCCSINVSSVSRQTSTGPRYHPDERSRCSRVFRKATQSLY